MEVDVWMLRLRSTVQTGVLIRDIHMMRVTDPVRGC